MNTDPLLPANLYWSGIQAEKHVILKALAIYSKLPLVVLVHGGACALPAAVAARALDALGHGISFPCTHLSPLIEQEEGEAVSHPWSWL